jgi:hypothetical protein
MPSGGAPPLHERFRVHVTGCPIIAGLGLTFIARFVTTFGTGVMLTACDVLIWKFPFPEYEAVIVPATAPRERVALDHAPEFESPTVPSRFAPLENSTEPSGILVPEPLTNAVNTVVAADCETVRIVIVGALSSTRARSDDVEAAKSAPPP